MAPTTTSSNLARRAAAASRADVGTAAGSNVDSQDKLARPAPTLAEALQSTHIRWLMHAGWAERLATTDARFGQWLADGQATLVKHGTNRLVYRVDSGDESLYVKRYRHRRGLARLAPLVRGSPARREWNKALELARRGIPTAVPVALGEDLRAGIPSDSLLVTREIPASQSLDQFLQDELPTWTAAQQRAARRWLVDALARLVAATHRAGVRHDDLHAGNILVNLDAARRLETPRRARRENATAVEAATEAATTPDTAVPLFLIDLPGVSFGRPLGRRASLASVVMLAAGLFSHSTSREHWRFWRMYRACRPDLSIENPREVAGQVVSRVLKYQRALAFSRDRRALATNRDFQRMKFGHYVCHATQGLSPDVLQTVLRVSGDCPKEIEPTSRATAGLPRSAGVEKVSGTFSSSTDGRPSRADEKVPDTFSPLAPSSEPSLRAPQLVMHRVPAARWPWSWLEHPARRRWRLGQALASRGIAIGRPLAALVPRWFAPWRDGHLVFGYAAPDTPLADVLASLEQGDSRDARRLAEACGAALGQLHRWQVNCPALSISSFAVRRESNKFEVLLADWTRAQIPRWSTPRQAQRLALRDLTALRRELLAKSPIQLGRPISRIWLARALRAYVAVQLREPTAWRELWRQLAE
jgi:hypothetical protein